MTVVEVRNVELAVPVMQALERASDLRGGKLELGIGLERWSMGERYQTLSATSTVDADMIWQATDDVSRLKYIVELSSALSASASELLKLYGRFLDPIISKLSTGIASLPDEVLGLIFRFAAHTEEEGTKYVERLSMVSHRFRRIVLEDSDLWSTLLMDEETKMGYIKTCISRSGADNDLHIIINYNELVGAAIFDEFIGVCASAASRWATLALSGVCMGLGGWDDAEDDYSMAKVLARIYPRQLTLPRLHELHLTQHYPSLHDSQPKWKRGSRIVASSMWTSPNLRVLRCTQYIPNRIFPLTSISSFSMKLTLDFAMNFHQLSDLRSFLKSLTSVSEIDLEIINFDDGKEMPDELCIRWTTIPLPSVTSFRLHVKDFTENVETDETIRLFVLGLRMPLIQDYILHFEWGFKNAYFSHGEGSKRLSNLMPMLSPMSFDHPTTKSFSVRLSLPDVKNDASPHSVKHATLVDLGINLALMPQISRLQITTCGRIFFGDKIKPPSLLREIRLLDCDNMDIEELRELIESLKEIGIWDPLERFIIQGGNLLESNVVAVMDIDREKIFIVA